MYHDDGGAVALSIAIVMALVVCPTLALVMFFLSEV